MSATVHLAARVEPDLAEDFRQICAAEERPVSQELRRLIRKRVSENDEGRPAQGAPVQTSVEQDRRNGG